jgi:AcrR family transcriptional regulator
MALLQKSIAKRTALLKGTLSLVNNGGIQGASMAKVAKIAGVSPATIYLYFECKQDLVSQLYLTVKASFAEAAFSDYDREQSLEISFKKIWFNMVYYKMTHQEEASFLSQCDNTPIIEEKTRQDGLQFLMPLFDLWLKGKKEGILKDISPYLMYAYSIYPMAFLMNMKNRGLYPLDEKTLQESYQAAWDSIKV